MPPLTPPVSPTPCIEMSPPPEVALILLPPVPVTVCAPLIVIAPPAVLALIPFLVFPVIEPPVIVIEPLPAVLASMPEAPPEIMPNSLLMLMSPVPPLAILALMASPEAVMTVVCWPLSPMMMLTPSTVVAIASVMVSAEIQVSVPPAASGLVGATMQPMGNAESTASTVVMSRT